MEWTSYWYINLHYYHLITHIRHPWILPIKLECSKLNLSKVRPTTTPKSKLPSKNLSNFRRPSIMARIHPKSSRSCWTPTQITLSVQIILKRRIAHVGEPNSFTCYPNPTFQLSSRNRTKDNVRHWKICRRINFHPGQVIRVRVEAHVKLMKCWFGTQYLWVKK